MYFFLKGPARIHKQRSHFYSRYDMKDTILLHNKGMGWRLLAGVADGDGQLHVAGAAVDAATHPAHEVAHTRRPTRSPAEGASLRRGLGHLNNR